ncbi:hypothetical protein LSAT2_008937 [Lamellibrachia satsuma]|nr:hypothetical protein LSAT2_008937 [Lamellibrachia satsuma]
MWIFTILLLGLVFPADVMLRRDDNDDEDDGSQRDDSKETYTTRARAAAASPSSFHREDSGDRGHRNGRPLDRWTSTTAFHRMGSGDRGPRNGRPLDRWTSTTAFNRDGSGETGPRNGRPLNRETTTTAVAQPQSDVPVRVCEDGWSKLSVLTSMHCLKGVHEARPWSAAKKYCHVHHSQLLTLDVSVFDVDAKDVSDVVLSGILRGIHMEAGQGESWTSLHLTDGKLWWDSDIPLAPSKRRKSLWQWGRGQPAGRTGDCGSASSSYTPMTLQLTDCTIKRPFVCISSGLDVSLSQALRCPSGWRGNTDVGQCYWSSGNQKKSFMDAKQDCLDNGASLTTPTTGLLHNLTMAAIEQKTKVWIGMTVNSHGEFQWINGQNVTSVRLAATSREHEDEKQCVYIDPERLTGHEWVVTDCSRRLAYICQKPAARTEVKILRNPTDLTTTTVPKQRGLNQPAMRCDASNYDRRKSVVWVHDGKYIDNGPPPGGFTLYVSSLGGQSEVRILPVELQGYYHCEVWGQNPMKKVASSKAFLRFNDVLTLRGTLRLPGGYYNSDYATHDLIPDSQGKNFTDMLTELGTVHFGQFSYVPVTRIQRYSRGSLVLNFAWVYSITGNRGPRRLSNKQYELLAVRLFAKVTGDIFLRIHSPSFYGKYKLLLSGIQRSDISLRRVDACPARLTLDANQRQLDWPGTSVGGIGSTDQVCLANGRPLGVSTCLGNYTFGAYWGPITLSSGCQEPEGSSLTKELRRLAETRTNSSNVGRVSDSAMRLTGNADKITYPDISYSSHIMKNMAAVKGVNHSVGRDMVRIANNILKAKREEVVQAQRLDKSSSRIVRALEMYGSTADLGGRKSERMVETNVALEVWEVSSTDPVVGFGSLASSDQMIANESLISFSQVTDLQPSMTRAAIVLPRSTIDTAIEIDNLLSDGEATTRLTFVIFNNPMFFLSSDELNETYRTDSAVISATFNGIQMDNLSEPVVTVFQPIEVKNASAGHTSSDCVFWDFDALDGRGDWSSEGCWYNGSQDGRIICMCDHMTNFAVLADVEATKLPESHILALSIITIIGVSLSMLGLVLTILSFVVFKPLRRPRGQKVLVNLALALLAVYTVFLAGIRATSNYNVCIAVAALLQYFLLASFAWMLVEAALLYMRFVKVFNTYVEKFLLKVSIPAWGVPAVIVGIVAAVDYDLFRGPEDYCWLDRPAFYYAFALPVGIVIVTNAVIFVFIIKGITCDRGTGLQSTQTRGELNLLQLQAAIASFVILGGSSTFTFQFPVVSLSIRNALELGPTLPYI